MYAFDTPTISPSMSLTKLGRYDLIRVLGKGAMGLVYEGRDPTLDRRVAIKTIRVENLSEEAAAEYEVRFRTEARSAARLQHPNIVSVYDTGRDGDIAFIVMEFIQGDDLKNHLDKGKLYTLEQTLAIMSDLLSALDYAHRQNIVHRDIKPANLLIDETGRVKLTDFGVARIQDSGDATRTQGTVVGTLKYMSPEQVQGLPVDARADLFAAGIVLFQLLTGKRPFDGGTDFAIIQQIATHHPAAPTYFNPQLPPAVDAVVALALAKSRDQRFASAQAFDAALQAACREAADLTFTPTVSSGGPGRNATWTATLLPGEALIDMQPTNAGVATVTQELELVYWKDIKDSNDIEDVELFLAKFPSGIYADLARRRLKKHGALASAGVGDDSEPGSDGGTRTLVMPSAQAGMEKTVFMPRTEAPAAPVAAVPASPLASPIAPRPTEPEATSQDSTVQLSPTPPMAPAITPTGALASSVPPAGPPRPAARRLPWALAAVALVAVAGLGLALWSSPGPAPDAAVVSSTSVAPTGTATVAATSPPTDAGSGTAQAVAVTNAAQAPVSALVISPTLAAAPASLPNMAASAPASKASAALAAAAAKKLAKDQEKLDKQARQAQLQAAKGSASGSDAAGAAPATEHVATPVAARDSAASPRQACEDRMLIGFQICMAEQCARSAFTSHPLCVQRRAMEQQRRESEQMRR